MPDELRVIIQTSEEAPNIGPDEVDNIWNYPSKVEVFYEELVCLTFVVRLEGVEEEDEVKAKLQDAIISYRIQGTDEEDEFLQLYSGQVSAPFSISKWAGIGQTNLRMPPPNQRRIKPEILISAAVLCREQNECARDVYLDVNAFKTIFNVLAPLNIAKDHLLPQTEDLPPEREKILCRAKLKVTATPIVRLGIQCLQYYISRCLRTFIKVDVESSPNSLEDIVMRHISLRLHGFKPILCGNVKFPLACTHQGFTSFTFELVSTEAQPLLQLARTAKINIAAQRAQSSLTESEIPITWITSLALPTAEHSSNKGTLEKNTLVNTRSLQRIDSSKFSTQVDRRILLPTPTNNKPGCIRITTQSPSKVRLGEEIRVSVTIVNRSQKTGRFVALSIPREGKESKGLPIAPGTTRAFSQQQPKPIQYATKDSTRSLFCRDNDSRLGYRRP